jgi:hypothetical protein
MLFQPIEYLAHQPFDYLAQQRCRDLLAGGTRSGRPVCKEAAMSEEPLTSPVLVDFTPAEWARLASYRAAVHAGFYNEGRASARSGASATAAPEPRRRTGAPDGHAPESTALTRCERR